ncbi:MAG: hypothetical protein RLZZ28_178 [Bacteroidota bacterium]
MNGYIKTIVLFFSCSLISHFALSQEIEEAQFDTAVLQTQPLIKINKEGAAIRSVNMIANMRFALNNNFVDGNFVNSQFKANDLRMEIIGRVSKKLKVRFRDVYSRSAADATTVDLLRRSIDLAYVEYEASPKLVLVAGKMFGEYGGYEIFYNPITMVVYNDWIANGDIFLSAVKANYKISARHTLNFQLANASSRSFDYNYGNTPGAVAAKAPMGLTLNWNGNFADNAFSTKWSYSNFNLTKGEYMNLLILGNQYKNDRLTLQYDFRYSNEALDRTGIISSYIGNDFANRAHNVNYVEHWLRGEYFFTPTISATAIGMLSSSYWMGNPDNSLAKTDLLRNSWTFTSSVECHLNKQHNIKLFLSYVGKFNRYTDYARNHFGLQNNSTGQILIGFMSHLVVF